MRGWLLDSNVVAELTKPSCDPRVRAWAEAQDETQLFLSVLTLGEYDKGLNNLPADHPARARIMGVRDALEERFSGRLLPLSNAAVRRWGEISGRVQRLTGHAPPVIDSLFAATALVEGLYLATRNVRDVQHSGAAIFDPWHDDPVGFPTTRRRGGHQLDR